MLLKVNLIMIMLFPLVAQAQTERYLFVQTEIDPVNAIFGGTVNPPGYDVVFQAGLSAKWFRAALFYENFSIIDYQSAGSNISYIFNYDRRFKQFAGIQLSLIKKPDKLEPSVAVNAGIEYHFTKFFFSLRGQSKLRSDWGDKIVNSGFVGIGYKIDVFDDL